MKRSAISATCVFLVGCTATALADPMSDCARGRTPALRLRACSEIIDGTSFNREEKSIAHRNRGNARADAGASEQAIADYSQAIRLNGNDAAAFAGRANARLNKGDVDGSIADFGAALRLMPSGAGAAPILVARGHAHLVMGRADAAIADFTEAVRLDPNSAIAFNNRGLAWRKKSDIDRAIEDYTAAITLNPVYALAYNNRGYAYEAKGRKPEAIADFDRALMLDGSLVGAAEGLKRLGASTQAGSSDTLVRDGKVLVEARCSPCHAVGPDGNSPNAKAPEFRNISKRHPVLALREPLTRGIAAPHEQMPSFKFTETELDKIIAYVNSLQARPK